MVWLSLAFLGLMTLALPHSFIAADGEDLPDIQEVRQMPRAQRSPLERAELLTHSAAIGLAVLAIPFWVEAAARLIWVERGPTGTCGVPRPSKRRTMHLVACALVPPLRPGLSPASMPGRTWLPIFGWRVASRPLSRRVQKAFSIPMIGIGLLILPVLALELTAADYIHSVHGLALGLDVATRIIWFAFALEFLVMLAVTPRKLEYATRHWVDLVIILLPFAAFLRSFQIIRAGQILKAQRMSKLAQTYRLRGLAVKLLQAVLMLRVLETLSDGMAKKRIDKVRETMRRHREELQELDEELVELRSTLASRLRRKRAKRREKARANSDPAAAVDAGGRKLPASATTPA